MYLRRKGSFLWSKYVWSLLAVVLTGTYVGWIGLGGETAATQLSPGSLASPHAALNTKCADCHTAYVSASADGVGVNWVSQKLLGVTAHPHVTDANCSKCHQHESKPHHSQQLAAEIASCAHCHADHRGASASLVRPDDQVCTICHENIGVHRSDDKHTPLFDDVAFFARAGEAKPAHPPFRSLPKTDDNNFKFNHQLHLLPGQWPKDGKPESAWSLDKIAAELRSQYKSVDGSAKGLVQLECNSCHVPHRGDPSAQSGAYMLPIRYEQHCQACHPLQVFGETPTGPQLFDVPHGLKQAEVRQVLEGFSARLAGTTAQPTTPSPTFTPRIPIPGKTPGNNLAQNLFNPSQVTAWQTRLLNDNCMKCHANEVEAAPGSTEASFRKLVGFAPPKIPERWLRHGEFNHAAHRGWADCKECHAQAYASEGKGKPPLDDQQVLIPNLDQCAQCHAPVSTHPTFRAAARFDCAECHRYHAGAH